VRDEGARRPLAAGAGVLALLGAAVLLVDLGNFLADLAVVVAFGIAVALARVAFRVHVELPKASKPARPVLFFNPLSGGGKASRFHLVEEARGRGIVPIELGCGEDLRELVEGAIEDGADALAMAGGDGSQAIVAEMAARRGLPYACIPAGTRNHFARDLGLDRDDPVAALAAFDGGRELRVDVGRAGDRLFLNNVSLGVYAQLVHHRERHRRRRAALARLRAFGVVLRQRDDDGITVDGRPVDARVVLVANNAYDLTMLSLGERPRIDEGQLHVYAPAGLLRSSWEEHACESLTVDARVASLRAAVDGEPDVLETPIAFSIEPRALRVLVPKEETMENPEPTETEQELAQTGRQTEEEDMRGTPDPTEQEDKT
jgi:diacylglycerol kinase family enzyme